METEMIQLARNILGDLIQVATDDRVLTLLEAALAELDRRIAWSQRLILGPLARGDIPNVSFDYSALHLLQAVLMEVHTLSAAHAADGSIFSIAPAHIGARLHPNFVEAYEARHHDTFLFTKLSLNKLPVAARYAEIAVEAFDVARGLSYTSALWH